MAFWARAFRTARRLTPILLIALAVVIAGCAGTSEQYPQSSLHPKSDMARIGLHEFCCAFRQIDCLLVTRGRGYLDSIGLQHAFSAQGLRVCREGARCGNSATGLRVS